METIPSLTTNQAAAVGAAFGAILGTILVGALIFYVLTVIATWKIFEKAGEPGWKAIIPIYNFYILYKIVKMEKWFWIMLGVSVVASIISVTTRGPELYTSSSEAILSYNYSLNPVALIALIVECVVACIASLMNNWRISKVFGHGAGYFIGLIFLPNIFWLILGFGRSKYNKKRLNA